MKTHSLKAEYWKYLIPVYEQAVKATFETEFENNNYKKQKHRFTQQMSYLGMKNLKSLVYPLAVHSEDFVRDVISQYMTVYVLSYAYQITKSFHIAFEGGQKMIESVSNAGTVFNTGITLFDRALDSPETRKNLKLIITHDYLVDRFSKKPEGKKDYSLLTDQPLVRIVLSLVDEYFIRCHELYEMSNRKIIWKEHAKCLLDLFHAAINGIEYSFARHTPTEETYVFVLERALAFSKILALISFLSPDTDRNLFRSNLFEPILDIGRIFVIIDDIRDVPDDIQRGLWSYVTVKAALDYQISVLEDGKKRDESQILQDVLSTNVVTDSVKDMFSLFGSSFERLERFIPPRRIYPLKRTIEKILIYSIDIKEK